ncbi:MAG: hypothetical protein WKG07_18750 [Hymenobacter sp.]
MPTAGPSSCPRGRRLHQQRTDNRPGARKRHQRQRGRHKENAHQAPFIGLRIGFINPRAGQRQLKSP